MKRWLPQPPRKTLALSLFFGLLAGYGPTADAGSWVFQRSYYSHFPAARVQVGPQAHGGPYYSRAQGDYVRFGFRQTYSTITIPGGTVDRVGVWETWIQPGSQR